MSVEERTAAHFSNPSLLTTIRNGLQTLGKDLNNLTVADLAPVDHHHGGGLEATRELANDLDHYASIKSTDRLLDIGSGLGGPARFFSDTYGCQLTGVDLTRDFCDVAIALNEMTGLSGRVEIYNASATDLPFDAGSFDHAYSLAVAMNIEDKAKFHSEAARVLKPGGCFALTETSQGPGGEPYFPMPYAKVKEDSFVLPLADTVASLDAAGFEILSLENRSAKQRRNHAERSRVADSKELPPFGLHLVMGTGAAEMMRNSARSFSERRLISFRYICRKY